jgi:hypothetical protein
MDRAYGMNGKKKNEYRLFVRKPGRNILLRKTKM